MWDHSDDPVNSEYLLRVDWVASVPRSEAKWQPNSGLYTTQLVRASLERQPITVAFIEREFKLSLKALAT